MSATSRSNALAERLEKGAQALAALASSLTPEQWQTRLPHDGRKVGVVVHHVASVYPIEIQLAQGLAKAQPMVVDRLSFFEPTDDGRTQRVLWNGNRLKLDNTGSRRIRRSHMSRS